MKQIAKCILFFSRSLIFVAITIRSIEKRLIKNFKSYEFRYEIFLARKRRSLSDGVSY